MAAEKIIVNYYKYPQHGYDMYLCKIEYKENSAWYVKYGRDDAAANWNNIVNRKIVMDLDQRMIINGKEKFLENMKQFIIKDIFKNGW